MKKTVLFLAVAMISMCSAAQITVPENLYFIGAPSPNGWAADKATPMTKTVDGDVTTFTWLGLFGAGEFRFLDQLNQWCGFGAQATVEDVVIGELHGVIPTCGNNFNILTGGTYLMTITMTDEYATMRIEPDASVFVPAEIWATGSALSNTIVKLPKLPDGKFLYGGALQTGELKFITTETVGATTRYIVPKTGSTSIIDISDYQITTSASEPGWNISIDYLPYKVKVNVANSTVNGAVFFPLDNLYIIGGCTPGAWSPATATPLLKDTEDSNVFIYDGELKNDPNSPDNGFRFLGQLDWGPDGFGSYSANEPIMGAQYVMSGSGTNWTISDSQQGHYEIRVNTLLETIEAVFDPAPIVNPTDIWAYGAAVSNEPVKLTKLPNGTFFYPGKFKVGELKFIDTETIGANTRYIVPATGSAPIAGQTIYRIKNDASLPGWNISSASPFYKVKVNMSAKTVNGEYYSPSDEMYIVGGCTPNGWEVENATPLVQNPENSNEFIFDGELKINPDEPDNSFRFIGQAGWGAIRFGAYTHGTPVTAAQYYLPNMDYNWTIDESQQGRYIIKVNTQYETIETQFVGGVDIKTIQLDSYFKILSSNGSVTIEMTDGYTAERVQIIDITGRVVAAVQNAAGQFTVGNQLSKGIYIAKIDCQGQSSVQKVLVK
jgi:hypothetical protein